MNRLALLSLCTTTLLACAACAATTAAALPMVRARAVQDLDCSEDRIRIEESMGGRYKAIGCGRKATYQTACDGLNCEVRGANEPSIPWRDRPEPGDLDRATRAP